MCSGNGCSSYIDHNDPLHSHLCLDCWVKWLCANSIRMSQNIDESTKSITVLCGAKYCYELIEITETEYTVGYCPECVKKRGYGLYYKYVVKHGKIHANTRDTVYIRN